MVKQKHISLISGVEDGLSWYLQCVITETGTFHLRGATFAICGDRRAQTAEYRRTKYAKELRKEAKERYFVTENGRKHKAEWSKRAFYKRYNNFGFYPISFEHPGCVWHHVNKNDVVAIPRKIHEKCHHSLDGKRGLESVKLEGVLG